MKELAQYYTISELCGLLNQTLQEQIGTVNFQGEITEIKIASSGHIYFSIKDSESKLECAIWRSYVAKLKFKPQIGQVVLCTGYANVYNVTGRFSINVQSMELAGAGDLQKKFIELQKKLEKEGLFDVGRKRPVPFLPKSVGIVTSLEGAAIQDILVTLNARNPSITKKLINVRVQGKEAIAEICAAIEQFNQLNNVDVIILARGGGSLEDLWAFNEEVVVRAVFASRIPIICGVGHETDLSLADLAADLRAATPTAAAKFAVPDRNELLQRLDVVEDRLNQILMIVSELERSIKDLQSNLQKGLLNHYAKINLKLDSLAAKVSKLKPSEIISGLKQKINFCISKLDTSMQTKLIFAKQQVSKISELLNSVNPKQVLNRGFAIVSIKGITLKSIKQVKPNIEITTELNDGKFNAIVSKV